MPSRAGSIHSCSNYAKVLEMDRPQSRESPLEYLSSRLHAKLSPLQESAWQLRTLYEAEAESLLEDYDANLIKSLTGPAAKGHAHKEWVNQYFPSNPYSASKAAQESIVFSYWRTYGLPIMITNTMNLIGEMQDPEKFLPMTMRKIMKGETVTIHGSLQGEIGSRFYLHARNQADALLYLLNQNFPTYGQSQTPEKFHIVGEREVNNLELAQMIAKYLEKPLKYEIVDFHTSRPGHDLRYALDGSKLATAGWRRLSPSKIRSIKH